MNAVLLCDFNHFSSIWISYSIMIFFRGKQIIMPQGHWPFSPTLEKAQAPYMYEEIPVLYPYLY